jgi:hypothetical protein
MVARKLRVHYKDAIDHDDKDAVSKVLQIDPPILQRFGKS